MPKPRLAILDDYQGIAAPKFAHLLHALDVETFTDHLDPSDPAQQQALIERLRPFTIISTMRERTPLPASIISALPNLQLVLTTGLKNASIDGAACSARSIVVAGAKGVGRTPSADHPTSLHSTLEHTWALILGISRNVARDDTAVKSGGWETSLATALHGKTLGVLGLGRLGADTARVGALAFGMRVVAWSSTLTQERADEATRVTGLPAGTFRVAGSKEELLREADVVSVHYVLSERSKGLLGERELGLLKREAVLVNTSRGPLVDEGALLRVLKEGRIRGAALDVFDREPLPRDSEWRTVKWGKAYGRSEVLLSPHMGYAEEGVMHRWYEDTVQNVEDWLAGKPLSTRIN
ncbi:D-isomer specific 2-hydroxyacid dehydrogenase [Macrophomina phaseolina]|uniref:D-isomer specific 2-hydroxyacid dehydrogenase n=1 Tax=Macrophomina phaseolina TaxID=35725 RepID=A0ABQ8G2T5_9PEZI|nr:D-isomer specific 2-hydroxyacid dehydrogenase [Macrophomina phaseolina]